MSKNDTHTMLTLPRVVVTRTKTGKPTTKREEGHTLRFIDALTDEQSAAIAQAGADASEAAALAEASESKGAAAAAAFFRMREGDLPCPVDANGRRLGQGDHWRALSGRALSDSAATRAMNAGRAATLAPASASLPVHTLQDVGKTLKARAKRVAEESGGSIRPADAEASLAKQVNDAAEVVAREEITGSEARTAVLGSIDPERAESSAKADNKRLADAREARESAASVKSGRAKVVASDDVAAAAEVAVAAMLRDSEAWSAAMVEAAVAADNVGGAVAAATLFLRKVSERIGEAGADALADIDADA